VAPHQLVPAIPVFVHLVAVPSIIGHTLFAWLLSEVPVHVANTAVYVAPVIALALGWLLLAEQVTPRTLGGVTVSRHDGLERQPDPVGGRGRAGAAGRARGRATDGGLETRTVRPRSGNVRRRTMEITRNSKETMTGPSEWFTGAVYVDTVAAPSQASRLSASSVHFTPGARTAWHTHPNGQTIYVTEGVGRVQRRGGTTEVIRPGDRVFFEPGEDHWHGAAPTRFMTHLALLEVDEDGNSATWGAHVTDEEYGVPTSLAVEGV
jgi:quercetin dioxygenase-like cupin family protein